MPLKIQHSANVESLAGRLAAQIREDLRSGRCAVLSPLTIVVPNPTLGAWLNLSIAKQLGAAVGIEFEQLERTLWQLVANHDKSGEKYSRLVGREMQRLILSFLTNCDKSTFAELQPVWAYIGGDDSKSCGPEVQRRAWQLSDRLAGLFAEYEVQRGAMIDAWRNDELLPSVQTNGAGLDPAMQRWQQRLYHAIFKPGGWRDRTLPRHLTLPQYAWQTKLGGEPRDAQPIYWFGIGHMATFHLDLLCQLGQHQDLYFFLPAACWDSKFFQQELLQLWGVACRQSQAMIGARQQEYFLEIAPCEDAQPNSSQKAPAEYSSLLAGLQNEIEQGVAVGTRPQDGSLQVWACPGKHREVESVWNLILQRLEADDTLRLSDIGIIVSDVNGYLPYIEEVFARQQRAVPYNLVDANAAQTSLYSSAVAALLGLVGSNFNRRETFALLSNPCLLAAVGADEAMPRQWLAWIDNLGIFHSYDRNMKSEFCDASIFADDDNSTSRKYADSIEADSADGVEEKSTFASTTWSDAHTWLAGLRRLRLGRVMTSHSDLPDSEQEYVWQGHIPYSDIETSSPALDRFSYAIELLVRQCSSIGTSEDVLLPSEWARRLSKLIDTCLSVPPNHPEESAVRASISSSLQALANLDACFAQGVSLDFARSHLLSSLEDIPLSYGRPLLGGVTITSPRQGRLLPFRDIYFLGLGEGQFPGAAERSTLDLRLASREEGDLTVPEINRQIFLDVLLSARERLVLTYSNRDLEKDSELGPCSLISQLKNYIERCVLPDGQKFLEAEAPLHGRSLRYFSSSQNEPPSSHWSCSPLVNFHRHDYELARAAVLKEKYQPQEPSAPQVDGRGAQSTFAGNVARADGAIVRSVTCRELRDFLVNPAEALLKRKLKLTDEAVDLTAEIEDEPFLTDFPAKLRLFSGVQERYVREMTRGKNSGADLHSFFDRVYDDSHQRGHTPDGVFAALDKAEKQRLFVESITREDGLQTLLDGIEEGSCCAVTLGSVRRAQSARAFPAVTVPCSVGTVTVQGSLPLVRRQSEAIHCLVLTDAGQSKKLQPDKNGHWCFTKHILEPLLFFVALQAGIEPGPDNETSAEWVGDRMFTLHVSSTDGLSKVTFALPAHEAKTYLDSLVDAYCATNSFEDIPLSVLSDASKLWPLCADNDGHFYRDHLEIAIEESLADRNRADQSRMELLSLIDQRGVPHDVRRKIDQRLMPLYRWRVAEVNP